MKKFSNKTLFIILPVTMMVVALLIYKLTVKNTISINQCLAIISENNSNENVTARFQKVITIIENNGFSREAGFLLEGNNRWYLNRFYKFSLELISDNKYELKVLFEYKSGDDNIPDSVLKTFRPELERKVFIVSIEESYPDVWVFSGLAFPLFVCKELKPN